jgi:hypothetical protein
MKTLLKLHMELHVQHEVNLTKVNLKYSYIYIQSVPRSKHSPPRL